MKVSDQLPPNFGDISAKFNIAGLNAVFTYGDTLYNPTGLEISDDLMVHEEVHAKQQVNPEEWWGRYLTDPEFRIEQELEAYRAQYASLKDRPRPERRWYLREFAKNLSSRLYGGVINKAKAEELIKQ
jgi:hypothetical protein